ncbi:hypothetical protein DW228_06285 [Bacteroides fragilis]|uniref:Uncharacterized protein n=1 Tax=Bacteroides fragilis TaxID=817 RepID=A0A396C1N3_BACFG|nr:hypothetical protein [Bacteroides fragilis]RHH14405.1 hypothetical protein DW228_06285 [Bacteroides fragilis]
MDKDCQIEFNGYLYVLNQCCGEAHEDEDLFEWCERSAVGEFTRYYDKTVFHTNSGFIAAHSDDLSNFWDI